jgi:hypothetical protein
LPFNYVEGENVAGWESIIMYNTMDPYDERSAYSVTQVEGVDRSEAEFRSEVDRLSKFR